MTVGAVRESPLRSPLLRLFPLALAFLLTIVASALFVTGGFTSTVLGVRVSARSPSTAAIAAALAFATWAILAYRANTIECDLRRAFAGIEIRASTIILTIALLAGAVSIHFGTFSASGADASGYFSLAEMLSQRKLTTREPLSVIANWHDGAATLAPLGWRARDDGEQVPTYAVGMPLMMALPHRAGGAIAASLIVPITFVIAIGVTGMIAIRLAGGGAGLIAATALATTPVALFEAVQPMSDVPVTAAWMICWFFLVPAQQAAPRTTGHAAPGTWHLSVAGFACALAVLIRPNLAPLAALPALWILRIPALAGTAARSAAWTTGFRPALVFSLPVAIAGLVIAFLQWRWFDSPFRSGYGTAEEIFAFANVASNAALYTRWLLETHGPWLLLAPLALLVAQPVLRWMLAFAALVCAAYLFYAVFEVWTYLRFLLPAMAIATIAVSILIAWALARLPAAVMPFAVLAVTLIVAGSQISEARERGVFRLVAQHARAVLAGRYLDAALRSNAVLVTGEQSGAMRYYTKRSILRWDLINDADFAGAIERLLQNGHEPWLVFDEWEESEVRRKFDHDGVAALDWPPRLDAGRGLRMRAWRIADRDRYLRGSRVITDRVQ